MSSPSLAPATKGLAYSGLLVSFFAATVQFFESEDAACCGDPSVETGGSETDEGLVVTRAGS